VRGPMVGAEGYLVRMAENRHRLVIAVDYVNQALSVEIDADCVEPLARADSLPGSTGRG